MGPDPLREDFGQLFRPHRVHMLLQQACDGRLDLAQRFATYVRHQQRLIVMLSWQRGHVDERARRVLAELRVDRSKRRVTVELDLVRGQRDQRAAAHRVVRNNGNDLAVVVAQGPGDLAGRQYEATGGVQDDLDRLARRRLSDGTEHALCVVDVDVPRQGDAKEGDRLLAVDQGNYRGIASLSDEGED